MKKLITLTILILALGSCTIQKRLHTGGYYIDFHSKYKSVKTEPETQTTVTADVKPEIRDKKSFLIADSVIVNKIETADPPENSISKQESLSFEKKVIGRTRTFLKKAIPVPAMETKQQITEMKRFNQQKDQRSSPSISDWDVDWAAWIGFVVIVTILILYFVYPTFGLVMEAILAIMVLIGFVCLICWIVSALGNFEWFWSGR